LGVPVSTRHLLRVHEDVLRQGWALTSATEMGLDSAAAKTALSPALAPDPHGAGKMKALDVVTYERDGAHLMVAEAQSTAIAGVPGVSARCYLVRKPDGTPGTPMGDLAARAALQMVPASLRRASGRMSATYLRYGPGAEATAHRDKFGDMVVIWVLDREGDGGESFLLTPSHEDVFRRSLMPGEMVIFADELFLHGVTPMRGEGASRDALIFITLKD
jgi:hypothetical protein